MESFEPLINLFVVLTVLSVAAEKLSTLLKLRNPELCMKKLGADGKPDDDAEKQREYKIGARATIVGVLLAIVVKADFFEIITHLDEPWSTLGWVRVQTGEWIKSYALSNIGTSMYTLFGCAVTGVALGFGSKFWHDVLDIVFQLRDSIKSRGASLTNNAGK